MLLIGVARASYWCFWFNMENFEKEISAWLSVRRTAVERREMELSNSNYCYWTRKHVL